MKLSISTKINGLIIFLLALIVLNVTAASYSFDRIGNQASQIADTVSHLSPSIDLLKTENPELAQSLQDGIVHVQNLSEKIHAEEKRASLIQLVILVLNVIIGAIVSLIVVRQITRPLASAVNLLRAIANGDLSQPDLAVSSQDEVGVMSQALNDSKNALADIFERLLRIALELEESTHEMVDATHRSVEAATQIETDATGQAHSVHEASEAMDEMETSIKTVTDSTQQALDSANSVNKQAEVGASAVQQSVEAMKQIEESSRKIEDIVTVITDITNQTNLLSLNAAIEAAKAGEMGKGFAVVADEVRGLAERSSNATQEIFELIQESTERVNNGTQLVQNAEEALGEIMSHVKQTSNLIKNISDTTRTHDEKGMHIVNTLKHVDQISDRTASRTNELFKASVDLEDTAKGLEQSAVGLHQIVETFKLPAFTKFGTGQKGDVVMIETEVAEEVEQS